MPKNEVSILIPGKVVIKDAVTMRELYKLAAQMTAKALEEEKCTADQAEVFLEYLKKTVDERDYFVEELVETVLNTAPAFTGGTKVLAQSFRIQEAFNGAREGDVVKLETSAQEALKKYFDDPEYSVSKEGGTKRETVKGWPSNAYLARVSFPYIEAICNPLTDERLREIEDRKLLEAAKDVIDPEPEQPAASA